jgi:macrolide transport system ATP-binding/permease protein
MRLFLFFRRKTDLTEELQNHLNMAIADRVARGESPVDARSAALRKFGNIPLIADVTRERWGWLRLELFMQDLRYALRQLRRSPAFTLTAILTLALGIGANTAIFTLVHAVMLKSLPVTNPGEIYRIGANDKCCTWNGSMDDWSIFSYPLYQYLRDHTPAFEEMAAFSTNNPSLSVRRSGTTAPAYPFIGEFVSGNYFSMFGLQASSGRLFNSADDAPGAAPVAVMSNHAWREHYAADPSIVGSTVMVNGLPFNVAGIAPSGFFGDRLTSNPPDFWIPLNQEPALHAQNSMLRLPNTHWLYAIGRAGRAFVPAQVQAQMTLEIQQWLRGQNELSKGDQATISQQHVRLSPGGAGISQLRDYYSKGLYLLSAISALVLLIACANLANLLLVREAARRRQTLIQVALGASPKRVLRSVLTESILLSIVGGIAGLLLAKAGTRVILLLAFGNAANLPIKSAPSWSVAGFAFMISLISGILFGIVPAWITSRSDPADALRGTHRATRDRSTLPQRSLIVIQAAFSLILLTLAGLLTASLNNLEREPFGFQSDGRLIVNIDPQVAGYKTEQLPALYQQLQDRLGQIPGVLNVGLSTYAPQDGCCDNSGISFGDAAADAAKSKMTTWLRVSPHYFETLDIPLLRGRLIGDQDTASSRRVAVIDESFARKFFPSKDPIGQHFGMGGISGHSGDYEIVGIVQDTRYDTPTLAQNPMFFLPLIQTVHYELASYNTTDKGSLYIGRIEVHVADAKENIEPAVRRTLASISPNLTAWSMVSLKDQVALQFNQQRLIARLTGLFSLLALTLASVGLYGVTAYSVADRTNEIGIRMALGANRRGVVMMVLKRAFTQTVVGLAIGIPFAFIGGHLVSNQLYKTKAYDPLAFASAALLLMLCALIAGLIPARRAASIDPMRALRTE